MKDLSHGTCHISWEFYPKKVYPYTKNDHKKTDQVVVNWYLSVFLFCVLILRVSQKKRVFVILLQKGCFWHKHLRSEVFAFGIDVRFDDLIRPREHKIILRIVSRKEISCRRVTLNTVTVQLETSETFVSSKR